MRSKEPGIYLPGHGGFPLAALLPPNQPSHPPTGLMTMLGGMDRAESVSNNYFLRLTGKWASIQAANPPFKL